MTINQMAVLKMSVKASKPFEAFFDESIEVRRVPNKATFSGEKGLVRTLLEKTACFNVKWASPRPGLILTGPGPATPRVGLGLG